MVFTRPRSRMPDSFASMFKVEKSAVGPGSGRHETARPMSQLGRSLPFRAEGGKSVGAYASIEARAETRPTESKPREPVQHPYPYHSRQRGEMHWMGKNTAADQNDVAIG
jgi:hypothetical protein